MSVCELCNSDGGRVLLRGDKLRLIAVKDQDHPYFLRVVWKAHVKEMTDLSTDDQQHFMQAVFNAEAALRAIVRPEKINLASLGNLTPHLHWHVIARFNDDSHFPRPIWAEALRSPTASRGMIEGRAKGALRPAFEPFCQLIVEWLRVNGK